MGGIEDPNALGGCARVSEHQHARAPSGVAAQVLNRCPDIDVPKWSDFGGATDRRCEHVAMMIPHTPEPTPTRSKDPLGVTGV